MPPQSQAHLQCELLNYSDKYKRCKVLVIPNDQLKINYSVAVTSSNSRIDEVSIVFVSPTNLSNFQFELNNQTEKEYFENFVEPQSDDLT